jgi:AcrR family transcriptional regulator
VSVHQTRPLRADAQRNRDSLLAAALDAFSADGPEVPLEAIARSAGVGIGTLYRHFPTRNALVETVYRDEVARLCDAVTELLAGGPADLALRAWSDRFLAYLMAKRGLADALRALIASGADPLAQTRGRLLDAVTLLVRAGVAEGRIRTDADPEDVLRSLSGVSLVAGEPDQRDQAGRLLDLLVDGLRYGARL